MATSIQHGCITATSMQDCCIMATTLNIEEFNVASGKEITCIGSEVTETDIDSLNKKSQSCIQPGGHRLKSFVSEN